MTPSPRPPRPLRRSVLYVPAANPKALAKLRSLDTDAVVFDLEDAVAPAHKPLAREHLVATFAAGGFGHRETVVRINAPGTPYWQDDLAAVARCRPQAVLCPKVSSPDDLALLSAALQDAGLGRTALWAMVETAAGLLRLDAIVAAGTRLAMPLDCLVVGTNDLALETGVDPGDGRARLLPWLMQAVLVARCHGVGVLDGVWNDFADGAGFEAEARQAALMGFDGKTLIHPCQVQPAHQCFSPSAAAVAEARQVVQAFDRPEHAGAGVINLDGRMVERLHLEQARRLLARHDAGAAGATR